MGGGEESFSHRILLVRTSILGSLGKPGGGHPKAIDKVVARLSFPSPQRFARKLGRFWTVRCSVPVRDSAAGLCCYTLTTSPNMPASPAKKIQHMKANIYLVIIILSEKTVIY